MLRERLVGALAVLSFTLISVCPGCLAQEVTGIDAVADRLVQKLQKSNKQNTSGKVVVLDFPVRGGMMTALGEVLATQLSEALIQRVSASNVVARAQWTDHMRTLALSPLDLRDRDIATWLAGETGAEEVVLGLLTPKEGKFVLVLELVRIKNSKQLLEAKLDLPKTDQISSLAGKLIDWPSSPKLAVACRSSTQPAESVAAFKTASVEPPACFHCTMPNYTDAARSARFQGTAKFNVIVDENGRATSISLVNPAGHGLDIEAIKTIRTWKFTPAAKDGKPVPVCVLIEVSFQIF